MCCVAGGVSTGNMVSRSSRASDRLRSVRTAGLGWTSGQVGVADRVCRRGAQIAAGGSCTTGQFRGYRVVRRGGFGAGELYDGAVLGPASCTTGRFWERRVVRHAPSACVGRGGAGGMMVRLRTALAKWGIGGLFQAEGLGTNRRSCQSRQDSHEGHAEGAGPPLTAWQVWSVAIARLRRRAGGKTRL